MSIGSWYLEGSARSPSRPSFMGLPAIKVPNNADDVRHVVITQGDVHGQHKTAREEMVGLRQGCGKPQFTELMDGSAAPLDQRVDAVRLQARSQIVAPIRFEFVVLVHVEVARINVRCRR